MSEAIINHLTLDSLREVLQQVGYRVETVTDPVANVVYLRSATNGLGFDVRPGNRLVDSKTDLLDATFTAVLQVQGELPLDLVNRWNATRRFIHPLAAQPTVPGALARCLCRGWRGTEPPARAGGDLGSPDAAVDHLSA